MDKKQKDETAINQPSLVAREVESINGYYKKVVLEPGAQQINTASSGYILNGLSEKVFNDRYALKDEAGRQIEHTPEEMWRRVAKNIASIEKTPEKRALWEQRFYSALEGFKFVPGGRILSGAGARTDVTYYNCYVLPSPEDSRGGIMDSVKSMVEIMARGGGVGINLSTLRPRGSHVKGVNGKASGAVSFGALYSFATGLVIQGGSRRGALMLMLNDHHPDVEEFVTVKRTMGQVTNANLSVCISDGFMQAVKDDADWDLSWGGRIYKTIKARALWDLITESAWASGEPGFVFMERANKQSNTWYFEDIISVNPCGEQPLPAWGVCNLGAINLVPFSRDDGSVGWDELRETVHASCRFLDNVIDATPYAFEENKKAQLGVRRFGLGTMGLGDFLIKQKVRYGSDEALALVEEVYRFIRNETYRAGVDIAKEKGAFPEFDQEKFIQGTYIKTLPEDIQQGIASFGIRNAVLQTQAPTGTTSMLADVSSGIEPVYDFAFKRTDRLGEHTVYHKLYKEYIDAHPGEKAPEYFVNAKQLTPLEHVKMQAMVQKYTDASISKTVNAPENHTHEQVKELYMKAYDLGCKGVTYYRENSRDVSVLSSLDDKTQKKDSPGKLTQEQSGTYVPYRATQSKQPEDDKAHASSTVSATRIEPKDRPEVMQGKTYKIKTPYGALYVTVNNDEDRQPFEVFATIGKSGGFFAESSEAICRLASLSLRSGIDPQEVIKQLKGIRGPMFSFGPNGTKVLSLPDAIAQILERHITPGQPTLNFEKTDVKTPTPQEAPMQALLQTASIADHGFAPQCPDCGDVLTMESGCQTCHSCGYSKCG